MKDKKEDKDFDQLLEYLQQTRGFDFSCYKRSSLMRRVQKQMSMHEIEGFLGYLDYLQVYPDEFHSLFNTILINVTHFFRDPEFWLYLRDSVLPIVFDSSDSTTPIRIWSAGCSSGQEAYSLAILLAEQIGIESFRKRVKIYATDIDEAALVDARQAIYVAKDLQLLEEEYKDRYFEAIGGRLIFRSDMRRNIIFGCHNLLEDAPISNLDLLVCRNTLMYFVAEAQAKVLQRFHFAVKDTGALFLGKAEMLLSHTNLFVPINLAYRIFRPTPKTRILRKDRLIPESSDLNTLYAPQVKLQNLSFDILPVAHLILDLEMNLILINALCRQMFGISFPDIGRPLQDLELSYRPIELRSYIQQVIKDGQLVAIENVIYTKGPGNTIVLDIRVNPLKSEEGKLLGVSLTFIDVTRSHLLRENLQQANQDLETANEELQSSNEEMETTNEELQSTNEELETTNEELQSTNEELETINEELQSTNEELSTANSELQIRTDELDQAITFLDSFMESLDIGVIVVDQGYVIKSWNQQSYEFWGLRKEEVLGQSLWSLDIGLPLEILRPSLQHCLKKKIKVESCIDAVNRRGKKIKCQVNYDVLNGPSDSIKGVIILVNQSARESLDG